MRNLSQNEIENFISKTVKDSLRNKKKIEKPEDVTTKGGHYVILCDQPVPSGADSDGSDVMIGDYYVWYNGTKSGSIRSRIKDHLFREREKRVKPGMSNGIRISRYPLACLEQKTQNYKVCPDNPRQVWQLGIDIREPQWGYYDFYLAVTETDGLLDSPIEQVFRKIFGKPPLCKSSVR